MGGFRNNGNYFNRVTLFLLARQFVAAGKIWVCARRRRNARGGRRMKRRNENLDLAPR